MRAISLRKLLVVLVPVHAAITGIMPSRVDVVHRILITHQHIELVHQRRVRGQQTHLAVRNQQPIVLGLPMPHQFVDFVD